MFHGSSPNSTSSCRMAQFMKAYPRSKTLSHSSRGGNESVINHMRGSEDNCSVYSCLIIDASVVDQINCNTLSICIWFDNFNTSLLYLSISEPSLLPVSLEKRQLVKDISSSLQASTSSSSSPTRVQLLTDVDVDVRTDVAIGGNHTSLVPTERCIRRAEALRRELVKAGSLDCVTSLGRQLFCLDVLG